MNLLNSTYNTIIKWSSSEKAIYYLFVVAFIESSFFPIPPDVMLIPMMLATRGKSFKIAGVATVASVFGGCFGYLIGMFLFDILALPLIESYNMSEQFATFEKYYHEYGSWIVFGAGLTPFPYKVITIASGVMHLNFIVFSIASILARGLRFYILAILLYKYGEPMEKFIKQNLGVLSILFFLALFAGFYIIKFL